MNDVLAAPLETEAALVERTERLLRQGEPLLACNVAQAGLQQWPSQPRLRQLQALALARSGDTERANRLLAALACEGLDDAETLGMLARTHKDLGLRATGAALRNAHLDAAFGLYDRAYRSSRQRGVAADAGYTGINAATLAVLRGDLTCARRIAVEVRELCADTAVAPVDPQTEYWRHATLGEAALILGDAASAVRHYGDAARTARGRYGDLSSTRRQAQLLAAHVPNLDARPTDMLDIPPVLVFTGHRMDAADRAAPRFPASLEASLRDELRASLVELRPLAAYGSAACGADILCHELVRELGGEIHVVLPFPAEEFRRTSVETAPGNWGERFDRVLEGADSVTVASDHRATGSDASFEYASLLLTGLGRLRARLLDTSLRGLAVWDAYGDGARGGVGSVVSAWRERRVQFDHVDLARLRRQAAVNDAPKPSIPDVTVESATTAAAVAPVATKVVTAVTAAAPVARHEIKALLFADAVGYSQLTEDQIPAFVTGFLGAIATLNRATRHRFEHVETSGDGIYAVFDDARAAAHYALELSALANSMDWTAVGLPANFNLRIALHCGPVYCGDDPVTGTRIYTGPHVSRAARIEPITPPGQVYASAAFAAVAAANGAEGLDLRYVGRIPLAKGSGSLSLYHVERAA
jgi:class 3 adenylate cyclase